MKELLERLEGSCNWLKNSPFAKRNDFSLDEAEYEFLIQLIQENEWKPIETAPKDGSWVMVWNGEPNLARWHEVANAWTISTEINPRIRELIFYATHWKMEPSGPEVKD